MEKREVIVSVGGQRCSLYSDDPDEYIDALTEKANKVVERFSGMNAKAILFLTDALMRAEKTEIPAEKPAERKPEATAEPKRVRKNTPKALPENNQVSMWDLVQAAGDPASAGETCGSC